MFNKIIALTFIITLLSGCKTNKDKIDNTISEFIETIEYDNYDGFDKLILNAPTVGDNKGFPLLKRLYHKSLINKKDLFYSINDTVDHFGLKQLKVNLPYFRGYDSITAIEKIDLILIFGPTEIFPLNKIVVYENHLEWNYENRRKILKLPELTKFQDSILANSGKFILEIPQRD